MRGVLSRSLGRVARHGLREVARPVVRSRIGRGRSGVSRDTDKQEFPKETRGEKASSHAKGKKE